jgi:peroxiredoxin
MKSYAVLSLRCIELVEMSKYNFLRFTIVITIFIAVSFVMLSVVEASAQTDNVDITIHLRGVYESKISLLSLSGGRIFVSIIEMPGIKNGETTTLSVPGNSLPGEFVLRFDYKEKDLSTPYPSEKYIFINDQDLELWVSPIYCNNADSTYFQANERENSSFVRFSNENLKQKEQLALLQTFLMNYDAPESKFYQQGIIEYEHRRQTFNQWVMDQTLKDKALFVSSMYGFQYVQQISWNGDEFDRIKNLIDHYFDGIDLKNPFLIKTSDINKWMDNYVNLYGQLAITVALRDSLFSEAGRIAIEKAKYGHPLVYGWMVDYFYRGYESNGMDAGMKILEPYLNDSTCLTSKRQEIARRLKGIETLIVGSKAPDISIKNEEGVLFELSAFAPNSDYILLLFWSADCSHCVELADKIYPWYQQTEVNKKLAIVAISLDDTDLDIKAWEQKKKELTGWEHLHDTEGVRSKVAADYYILSTPVMFLLDKDKKIIAQPLNLEELTKTIENF